MLRIKNGLFILTISLLLFMSYSQSGVIACKLVSMSNYIEISDNIYVSDVFTAEENALYLSQLDAAKKRITETFGEMSVNHKVIIPADGDEVNYFAGNPYGVTHLSPLGECIVIGAKGRNIDVIAHEYIHAEVHYRLGWLMQLLYMPVWLNEGIGTLVDFRKSYRLENITLSPLQVNDIRNRRFTYRREDYQAARVLAEKIDKSDLYESLLKLRRGEDLNSAFNGKVTL